MIWLRYSLDVQRKLKKFIRELHKLTTCVKITNAMDEVINSGGEVDVYYEEVTREAKVVDTGRGIPHEKLADLCEVLHSSGKFSNSNDSAYTVSSGINGVGLKIVTYLSEYFTITSVRDGKSLTRKYEDGYFVKEISEKADPSKHGTTVVYKLSDKYLKETDKVTCKKLQKLIEEKTDCCENLVVTFHGVTKDGKKIKEKYKGLNISNLMKKYMKPTSKTWEFSYSDSTTSYELMFGYDTKAIEGSNLMGWTNFIYNKDGGTHVDAIADTIFDVFKRYMLNNFFSDKEKKNLQIRREDVRLGLCGVVVIKTSKDPLYYGQFKQKVTADWITNDINTAQMS